MRSLVHLGAVPLLALALTVPRAGEAQPSPAAARAAAPTPARVTRQELARLRWIVGDWRGTGAGGTTQAPFYERYRFADDSTLVVEHFPDSTFRSANDSSRYALRGGRLAAVGGSPFVATRLDSLGVEFRADRGGFRWERTAGAGARPSVWRAVILPPTGSGAGRHYEMRRVR